MIHFCILAVGRLKESYLVAATDEYLRRMAPYARVQVHEVGEEAFSSSPSPSERAAVQEREAARLTQRMPRETYLVALAPAGKMLSSEDLAALVEHCAVDGHSHMTFLVGGPLGLAPSLLERAQVVLSFSRLTFPHQLFRLILCEQLYRACKILRHEPYHW